MKHVGFLGRPKSHVTSADYYLAAASVQPPGYNNNYILSTCQRAARSDCCANNRVPSTVRPGDRKSTMAPEGRVQPCHGHRFASLLPPRSWLPTSPAPRSREDTSGVARVHSIYIGVIASRTDRHYDSTPSSASRAQRKSERTVQSCPGSSNNSVFDSLVHFSMFFLLLRSRT